MTPNATPEDRQLALAPLPGADEPCLGPRGGVWDRFRDRHVPDGVEGEPGVVGRRGQGARVEQRVARGVELPLPAPGQRHGPGEFAGLPVAVLRDGLGPRGVRVQRAQFADQRGGLRFVCRGVAVREVLGRLAAQAAMVESMMVGMEVAGHLQDGYYVPDKHMMYAAQVLTQELYPRLIETIRGLAGGALIMLPSSERDWSNPELAAIIGKTQRSPNATPQERVHFLRLAWDALGSEFASRHVQYEMFYAGAAFVTRGHSYRTFDWTACKGMVDAVMASEPTPGAETPASAAAE